MENRLEPGELLRAPEDDLADAVSVDVAVGDDVARPSARPAECAPRGSSSSSWTTSSVESVAAPSRANALSASDLPAAIAAGQPNEWRWRLRLARQAVVHHRKSRHQLSLASGGSPSASGGLARLGVLGGSPARARGRLPARRRRLARAASASPAGSLASGWLAGLLRRSLGEDLLGDVEVRAPRPCAACCWACSATSRRDQVAERQVL